MESGQASAGWLDRTLGIIIRVLLVAVFALGGAWAATAIHAVRIRGRFGAAVGFAIIIALLIKEKAFAEFYTRHAACLLLIAFTLYVILLGAATYSELFDLGWFNWLSP